ncbi:hypothetical protein LCGC14_1906120, partial [marine sediment metagenome]
ENISSIPIPKEELDKMQQLNSEFCHTYYPTGNRWMGDMPMQWPIDLMYYQEIMWQIAPTIIVETGTLNGGTVRFLDDIATLMKIKNRIDDIKIITIDINDPQDKLPEETIFIKGKSVEVVDEVKQHISPDDIVLVMLDSEHTRDYVLKEMFTYGNLVTPESYMIVQDTSGDVRNWSNGGPWGAIQLFLGLCDDFEIDYFYDRWVSTQHPRGYLKKRI